ncbi:hypothetical protein PIB30_007011 [Stylosanthes scabra]|uniref:C2 NT-type domain-containing protein n=1 Tax=Stylosanthes scabra TaxID=79078 RepID=A0ABU6Z6F1_9FABA|nr:hypothetical protein [Stylosanthes scabra]
MKLLSQNHINIKKEKKKNYTVKLNQLKLDIGLFGASGRGVLTAANDKVAVQIISSSYSTKKPNPPNSSSSSPLSSSSSKPLSSLLKIPFHRNPNSRCNHTTPATRFLSAKAPSFTWDARDLSNYHLVLKQNSSLEITFDFHVLYGEGVVGESDGEMAVVGKASTMVDVAEEMMMKKTESNSCSHRNLQRKLPIKLRVNGLLMEASLSVSIKLTRVKNSDDDSSRPIENSVESKKRHAIIERVKYLTSFTNNRGKNVKRLSHPKPKGTEQSPSPYESDGSPSPVFDSDDSSESTTSSGSSRTSNNSGSIIIENHGNSGSRLSKSGGNKNGGCESERFIMESSATRTRLDGRGNRNESRVSRNRSFTGLGFNSVTAKQEFQLATRSRALTKSHEVSSHLRYEEKNCSSSRWKSREISSRDGKLKLKTNVFLASFDQMSEEASGDSACSVLVALIAHWLHSNNNMPTMSQFDNLITQGSSEWRKLCKSDYYLKLFPDKHFDLETVLEANLRPIIVVPQESYTGFFSPEKFQCLKGAMSFDQIWDEIRTKVDNNKPRIYIVSWNDHFFVLKVEKDAYYVIDSLGERLYEGCQQAFILKFDESSVMYRKVERKQQLVEGGSSRFEAGCRGKECCKEFIKRFLAAISVRQLEKEEKKGNVSNPFLHRQLQIDFHYSTITTTSSAIRH